MMIEKEIAIRIGRAGIEPELETMLFKILQAIQQNIASNSDDAYDTQAYADQESAEANALNDIDDICNEPDPSKDC